MVAVIKTGTSIRRIFHYNENKVSQDNALCIGAENYPADHDKMNVSFKINHLLSQLELNENVKRGSVHISLNFHPSETDLDAEKLIDIARSYMSGIGFGQQPYLVYQHFDAAHPHIHIISIKVRPDGKRIDMQNIGRNQSEAARIKIENDFNLVKAQGRVKEISYGIIPIETTAVNYGKLQSKKAVAKVLDFVLHNYQFRSLPQLNAVLNLYNVSADRGSENSRIFKAGGLVYRILDKEGNHTGVPIKASDFYSSPTLKFLEKKFEQNKLKNQCPGLRIKNAIRNIFEDGRPALPQLSEELDKIGISMVQRISSDGRLFGLTYVDHVTKQICNGSELGKEFSAAAISKKCSDSDSEIKNKASSPQLKALVEIKEILEMKKIPTAGLNEIIQTLFEKEFYCGHIPKEFKRKRKNRKRKGLSNN
ncbi:relaxase/mobilization nuclease domain-containing protein [Flavobacterium johnsoniae]|uniref:Bacteroides conjugative transposon BmgA/MocA-like protein n=1 Tax=Flavobacterium johnsoniae (strain ATCC 17061 / DSM 2064 / JCM 8514 / BCRC 14874 / CCUG 350202 / NBRC 14942 / NCIMB 11054 / UW101) TaxID=376686 RepID=A5FDZ8_FLAJ1|nr:relaxase/mobilization nuclease domain-containing protein [Flavobacterium johnsoniae]ABQ06577.1 Bacteroides conjugative transposon BmgA/MocA-like protein [Flavobacterium johnsoniae UW101]OXE99812.1 relaxase [Flavobacterium johnsoniae UW101]WQG82327.1 relaxase/mobilization nuclease domain-containing protein [Flavobacterium johnsoniae UW101]SHK80066.1 Relaxase/Mobilisation nuclease domain-containing protein [Flavobacterium johnsoniae]